MKLKNLYKTLFWDFFLIVAEVLCIQSAKLSKTFKACNTKFRASLSVAMMLLENSSQNEKKIHCSPILGHFFLVDVKIMSIGTASALVLCSIL